MDLLERPEYNFLRTDLHLQFRFLRFAQRPGTAAGLRQGTYIPPEDARSAWIEAFQMEVDERVVRDEI